MAEIDVIPVSIAQGTAISAEVDIGNKSLVGIVVPSAWVTAGISLQASADGGTSWGELVDQTATAIGASSITGGAQVYVAFDPTKLRGPISLKVRSGTAGAPVNQTAVGGVTLQLVTRLVF